MALGNVAVDRDGIQWAAWGGVVSWLIATTVLAIGLSQRSITVWVIVAAVAIEAVFIGDIVTFMPRWIIGVVACIGAVMIGSRGDNLALFLLVLGAGEAATTGSTIDAGLTVSAAIAALSVRIAVSSHYGANNYASWFFGTAAAAASGLVIRALLRLNARLNAAQATVAAQATIEERRRLAREIHDVIAHSMTVTMLHVTAARLALRDSPPSVADAVDALTEAETQGRRSLADIRRTVGLLTSDESGLDAPVPGAADLADLIESFRAAGLQIVFDPSCDLGPLSPATGAAVYRVVQEALANAAKHAPGAAVTVSLRVRRRKVGVLVTNAAASSPASEVPAGGRGISGMTERVRHLGGRLQAGPAGEGWRVQADLPVGPPGDACR
ncbi:MAG: sensor histidine kinase [Acidimicrobiales bacterium]